MLNRIDAPAEKVEQAGLTFSLVRSLLAVEQAVIRIETAVMFLATMAMLLMLLAQVLARGGIGFQVDFSDEVARLSLMWLMFIGAAHGSYRGEHFAVDFIMDRWGSRGKVFVEAAVVLTTLVFIVVVAWASTRMVALNSVQRFPSLDISMAWSNAALPVGLVLMTFHTALLPLRRRMGLAPKGALSAADGEV